MNLTYPKRLALIDLTKAHLAKMCLYTAPARPCNDNESCDSLGWNNRDWDTDNRNPCIRLVDKVGSSWQIRRASLLAVANRSAGEVAFIGEGNSLII